MLTLMKRFTIPHLTTLLRGLPIAYRMIIPTNDVIPTYEMTACSHDVATFHDCKTTCLLAFSTPFKCSKSWQYDWSTSWTVTRWVWAFFLYCWRVFWLRFFLASEIGCVGGGVGGECWTGPKCRTNDWSMANWIAVIRPRMLALCCCEKPGIGAWFGCGSPLKSLQGCIVDWLRIVVWLADMSEWSNSLVKGSIWLAIV